MKEKIKNKVKTNLKEKGITLTALVVTIIILLILATITIRAISGDNGIIRKTGEAVNAYKIAENKEQETLEYLYGELNPNQEITVTLETLNTLIDKKVDNKVNEKLSEKVYPVGSIYITTTNTNPSELFGGTWESYGQGRTLIGAGNGTDANNETKTFEVNSTGGEYNHTLTIAEMPRHDHEGMYYAKSNINKPIGLDLGTLEGYQIEWNGNNHGFKHTDISTGYTGENQAHNIIQPYIVTYMWKRIA